MSGKLTNLTQLQMAMREAQGLSAQVAVAAEEAIEELAAAQITMKQVDAAIQAAIAGTLEEEY